MRQRQAFSLIELLVVIAIIGILAALLFPVFGAARAMARRTVCITQLRQLGMALQMYRQDYEEYPLYLSSVNASYVKDPRLFVCPNDPQKAQREGNARLEGTLFLPTGVSYTYEPQWYRAQELAWWNPAPHFGSGKWDDLTPLADCPWHWATRFNLLLKDNEKGVRGWQLMLTAGGSVRRIRVEDPIGDFTPEKYR
jgi:prepilin-type N-terminal cleavage/methylation domain-containing protein